MIDDMQWEHVELPHRGSMRWIECAALLADGTARAAATIAPDHPFRRGRDWPATAFLELMAQTAAAGAVLRAGKTGRQVKHGMLVKITTFEVCGGATALDLGDQSVMFECVARQEKAFGSLTQVQAQVMRDGLPVARAGMTFQLEFE